MAIDFDLLKNACLLFPGGQRLQNAPCRPALNYILWDIVWNVGNLGSLNLAANGCRSHVTWHHRNMNCSCWTTSGISCFLNPNPVDSVSISVVSLCRLPLPTNDAPCTVAEAKKKTMVFLWLSYFSCSVSVTTNQSDWSISSGGDRGLFIICEPLGGSLPNTGLCPLWSA